MRRADREQSREFSLALIDRCSHGVMALSTGGETPYCIPLSFVRVDDRLYFHGAKEGRKADLLARDPRVCITFVGGDEPEFVPPAIYTTFFSSAVVTGTVSPVTDREEMVMALRALCTKLLPGHMAAFDTEIGSTLAATALWRVDMEEITGKAKLR